jgi:hypothetical protein
VLFLKLVLMLEPNAGTECTCTLLLHFDAWYDADATMLVLMLMVLKPDAKNSEKSSRYHHQREIRQNPQK